MAVAMRRCSRERDEREGERGACRASGSALLGTAHGVVTTAPENVVPHSRVFSEKTQTSEGLLRR